MSSYLLKIRFIESKKVFWVSKTFLLLFLFFILFPLGATANKQSQSTLAINSEISLVDGIAVDTKGNIYISNRDGNIISRIDLKGKIQTVVGSGTSGFGGDGGPALKAKLKLYLGEIDEKY